MSERPSAKRETPAAAAAEGAMKPDPQIAAMLESIPGGIAVEIECIAKKGAR